MVNEKLTLEDAPLVQTKQENNSLHQIERSCNHSLIANCMAFPLDTFTYFTRALKSENFPYLRLVTNHG